MAHALCGLVRARCLLGSGARPGDRVTFAECEIVANVGAELRELCDSLIPRGTLAQYVQERQQMIARLSHMLGQLATLPLENEPDTHSRAAGLCDFPDCDRAARWFGKHAQRCDRHV